MLSEQTLAPDFTLLDSNEQSVTLSQFRGSYVLMYFYPKDDTPGCTREACMITEVYDDFQKLGITVLGISKDNPASHIKFKQKYNLPFTLLSDTDRTVAELYGATNLLSVKRVSYLINPEGIIVQTYPSVDPASHAQQILDDVSAILNQ